MDSFENKLRDHARCVKDNMASPFEMKKGDNVMRKTNRINVKLLLVAAAIVCAAGTTVFAAYRYMTAEQAVNEIMDNAALAAEFDENEPLTDTVTDGEYKATVLGITSGENLTGFKSSSWDTVPERTYAVVAVERTDGTAMTYEDEILVTPLVLGHKPWQYNIFTLNGGYSAKIIDGVLYRVVEFDSFDSADASSYIAVLSEGFIDNSQYSFDEESGEISPASEYGGTNILFEL